MQRLGKFSTILWCYDTPCKIKINQIKKRNWFAFNKEKKPAIINLLLNKKSYISKANEQDYLKT